ncbi:hypothetical protein V8C86DRAFT_1595659 [Haematococcus lacustris]
MQPGQGLSQGQVPSPLLPGVGQQLGIHTYPHPQQQLLAFRSSNSSSLFSQLSHLSALAPMSTTPGAGGGGGGGGGAAGEGWGGGGGGGGGYASGGTPTFATHGDTVAPGTTAGAAGPPLGPPPGAPLGPLLDSGVVALSWGPQGYTLVTGHTRHPGQLVEIQFAHALPTNHRVAHARLGGAAPPYPPWPPPLAAALTSGVGSSRAPPPPRPPLAPPLPLPSQGWGEELHVLQAHDRLLLVSESLQALGGGGGGSQGSGLGQRQSLLLTGDGLGGGVGSGSPDLLVSHLVLPHAYISANWPLLHTAVSPSGLDIAVAGRRGLALFNRPAERWRLFGDVRQERHISCRALSWLDSSVLVVASGPWAGPEEGGAHRQPGQGPGAGQAAIHQLLLFPRYHLDLGSVLCQLPLSQPPCALDCACGHVLIASRPLDIAVYAVTLKGHMSPSGKPTASLQLVREVSMLDVGKPLLQVALVPSLLTRSSPAAPEPGAASRPGQATSTAQEGGAPAAGPGVSGAGAGGDGPGGPAPHQCVLLRWGGLLSVLDLERGAEVPLAADMECFWISHCQEGLGHQQQQQGWQQQQQQQQQGSSSSSSRGGSRLMRWEGSSRG